MSFGFPWGLLALGALVPLAAAYFLRRRQKPVTVSALFLWRTPRPRAEAGPRFERFTREASLLLEVLAVVAAALFLADVRFSDDTRARHVVLVVDGSLSLSARGADGVTVLERVRREAARRVEETNAWRGGGHRSAAVAPRRLALVLGMRDRVVVEAVARAADGEAFLVKQLADAADQEHFMVLVVASVAAPLDRPQLRELLFPVTEYVRFDAAQIAHFTDREVALGRDRRQLNRSFVALHGSSGRR